MLAERLAEARRRAGMTQIDLAVALGDERTQQMISLVERGHRGLRPDDLVKVARELAVTTDYLLGASHDPAPASQIRATYDGGRNEDQAEPGIRPVAVLEVMAAVGSGAQVYDETPVGVLWFRDNWLRRHRINPRHCHIIGVRGDSMEPTLTDGSQVIVDRSRQELRAGRIYVMRTEEGVVVKRAKRNAQGWWLMSDNPEWPPLFLTEETDIIGEVRWMGRAF